MKRKLTGMLAVSLSFAMLFSACSGAKSSGESPSPSGNAGQANPSGASKEPITINLFRAGQGLPAPDQDILLPRLNEALNMKLNYKTAPTEYEQQLTVQIAGGTPPDMFSVTKEQMYQFVQQGLLLDLTPYLSSMKHITEENGFTKMHMLKGVVDGKQYAIPYRPLIPVQTTFWVRQDWLDKLGLKAPKTLDELKAVAKAFVEQDPDGNGKRDTIGITGNGLKGTLSPIFAAFGVAEPGQMMIRDNKVVYSTELPETREAIAYINKMLSENLIDPEFLTNNSLMHQEKAFTGKAGIIYAHWAHIKRADMVAKMNAINPNQVWTQLDAMVGPNGQKFADYYDEGAANQRWVIPKSLAKQPEKVKKVLEYLDYVSGGEGQLLVNYGIEGRNYKMENGKIVLIPENQTEMGHASVHQTTGRVELDYLNTKFPDLAPYFNFTNKLPVISVYGNFATVPAGVNPADKLKYEEEELVKFIYGRRPLSEMDAFIKTLRNTYGLDKYIEETTKAMKVLGILK